MEDLFGMLIFFIAVVLSIAQKMNEGRKANAAKKDIANRIDGRKTNADRNALPVRQAQPREAKSDGVRELNPGTTGKELLESLFGEGAADSNEGWTPVQPAREQAVRQREKMEREHAHNAAKEHEQEKRQHAAKQQQQQQAQSRQQQPSREQVIAERKRRKDEGRRRQQVAARQQQESKRPRTVAPAVSNSYRPQGMADVRRAIVMSEILGPPKAYEDN